MNSLNPQDLEARVNTTGGNDPCVICNRYKERTLGETETYLVETEDWVCPDCAFGMDKELARFAYDPEYVPPIPLVLDRGGFGHCPVCGSGELYLNVYKTHWIICERHGLRWCAGYNLLSSWQYQTEQEWILNDRRLTRFRETEPYYITQT